MNNPYENEKGIYLSPYMRNTQINFFYKIGVLKSNQNARINGYQSYYKHKHKTVEFSYEIKYNQFGFRSDFPPLKKDSNEYRITCLGDSFVEGFGTSSDSTFPKLLENQLSYLTNKISVLNGGICGSNPQDAIKLYNNKLKQFNADLIILEINSGDLYEVKYNIDDEKMSIHEHFYAVSHLYRLVITIWQKANIQTNFHIDIFDPAYTEESKKEAQHRTQEIQHAIPKEIDKMFDSIHVFHEQLIKEKKELVIVYLPLKKELFDNENGLIKDELIKRKINFIDLEAAYKKSLQNNLDNLQDYYWEIDGHHTSKGYYLMATTVAQIIRRENNIK
jgi:lysophospholipase L1-like esterase